MNKKVDVWVFRCLTVVFVLVAALVAIVEIAVAADLESTRPVAQLTTWATALVWLVVVVRMIVWNEEELPPWIMCFLTVNAACSVAGAAGFKGAVPPALYANAMLAATVCIRIIMISPALWENAEEIAAGPEKSLDTPPTS